MPRRVYDRFCPLSLALEDVGDRWTLHVVYALLSGPKRYAELKHFLDGAGSNVLGDRLRRLADAHVVGRQTGARPGSETTYYLSERGRALAPVINALVDWGLPALTATTRSDAEVDGERGPEVFDQTWAVPDRSMIQDETYQWTVDGVASELVVSGCSLVRSPGPARNPIAGMVTTTEVLHALASGGTTVAQAVASGELMLNGPKDALRRMFIVTALPGAP
jgi:DNA-binding HxlR family transcriptional regulator